MPIAAIFVVVTAARDEPVQQMYSSTHWASLKIHVDKLRQNVYNNTNV